MSVCLSVCRHKRVFFNVQQINNNPAYNGILPPALQKYLLMKLHAQCFHCTRVLLLQYLAINKASAELETFEP